jgi:predicted permease
MLTMKQKNKLTKQLISVQILWTIMAPLYLYWVFFFKAGHQFALILIILIVLSNVFIILRNAIEIDRNKKLRYNLNFSFYKIVILLSGNCRVDFCTKDVFLTFEEYL